jgi:phenylacetate-CoA ligase
MVEDMRFWDERIERLDRERLRYLQEEALRRMVSYVYNQSEFYRRRFDEAGIAPGDIRTLEDFRHRIPLTTKEDLRLSQERMVRAGRPPYAELLCCADDQVILTIATSGTTGAPTVIPLTRRDASMYHLGELGRRGFVSAGVGPGDVVASAFNYTWWFVCGGVVDFGGEPPDTLYTAALAHIGRTDLQIRGLKDFGVTVWTGTPSYAMYLAEAARRTGMDPRKDLKVRKLFLAGEAGASNPDIRSRIEREWAADVFDMYGMVEMGYCGNECVEKRGLHLPEDWFFFETVDIDTQEPTPAGERGILVITHLRRQAMPILRYRIDDITTIREEPCGCGRNLARLEGGIVGRSDDMLKVKGLKFFPSQLEAAIKRYPQCTGHYLVIIDKDQTEILDTITIRVEYDPRSTGDVEALRQDLQRDLTNTFFFAPKLELIPEGSLARFSMKAMRVIDLRRMGAKEKFDLTVRMQKLLE